MKNMKVPPEEPHSSMDWKKRNMLVHPNSVKTGAHAAHEFEKIAMYLDNQNVRIPYRQDLQTFRFWVLKGLRTKGLRWYVTNVFNPLAIALGEDTVKPEYFPEDGNGETEAQTPEYESYQAVQEVKGLTDFMERTPKVKGESREDSLRGVQAGPEPA